MNFLARPLFRVASVSASLAYYEKLGFKPCWTFELEGETIIAQVEWGDATIILDSRTSLPKAAGRSVLSLTLHEEGKLGELHEGLRSAGAIIMAEPFKVAWDPKIFQIDVADPDGNLLVFWGTIPD